MTGLITRSAASRGCCPREQQRNGPRSELHRQRNVHLLGGRQKRPIARLAAARRSALCAPTATCRCSCRGQRRHRLHPGRQRPGAGHPLPGADRAAPRPSHCPRRQGLAADQPSVAQLPARSPDRARARRPCASCCGCTATATTPALRNCRSRACVEVSSQADDRRLPMPGPIVFGRGLEITLTFDENRLSRHRASSCSARSWSASLAMLRRRSTAFTETVIRTTERGEIMRWPAKTGISAHPLNTADGAWTPRPWDYDFFQALRRIECADRRNCRAWSLPAPADDPPAPGPAASAFAPSTLASMRLGSEGGAARLESVLLRPARPQRPPAAAPHRIRAGTPAQRPRHHLAAFLDIFHHRLLSLFYRAWADSRPTVSLRPPRRPFGPRARLPERPRHAQPADQRAACRHLPSCTTPAAWRARPATPRPAGDHLRLLPPAGARSRNSSAVAGTAGRAQPARGRQARHSACDLCLGSARLGPPAQFRIRLGPLELDDYQGMLPDGEPLSELVAWVAELPRG